MNDTGGARDASPCLAIDIGASKVDVAVVQRDGSILARDRLNVAEHAAALFEGIVALARDVKGDIPVSAVGVGSAGPMTRGGETVSPLNIPWWREFPLRDKLREALGLDVYVDGDARALALAEGAFGGAREWTSYLSMVVSTGVGGGFVLNGHLLDGETGNSGHVGHLNVVSDGALCSCGAYGCLEAEVSGRAIEERTGQPASEAGQATRQRTGRLVGRAVGTLASVLDYQHCFMCRFGGARLRRRVLRCRRRRPLARSPCCRSHTISRYAPPSSAATGPFWVRHSWVGGARREGGRDASAGSSPLAPSWRCAHAAQRRVADAGDELVASRTLSPTARSRVLALSPRHRDRFSHRLARGARDGRVREMVRLATSRTVGFF